MAVNPNEAPEGYLAGANTEVKDWTKVGWIPVGDSAEMARREAIRQELQARVNACPFCGHEPRLHMKNRPGERPAITCQCGASMAFDGKTEFYLIEQWNRRAKQCA